MIFPTQEKRGPKNIRMRVSQKFSSIALDKIIATKKKVKKFGLIPLLPVEVDKAWMNLKADQSEATEGDESFNGLTM